MPQELLFGLFALFAWAGLLMAALQYAALGPKSNDRIRPPRPNKITLKTKITNVAGNMVVALIMIIGSLFLFTEQMITTNSIAWYMVIVEALIVLMLYDFMYYFFHRGMHHPKAMKHCHGTHHYIRHPTAFESFYVHPLEGIGGLSLILLSILILGPISITSYLLTMFIYMTCNILVHGNVVWKNKFMWLPNYWAKRHDIHHGVHLNRNYASIFPFWDKMFGTYA